MENISPQLKALLQHLIMAPHLPTQLRTLHSLALYDSGDAFLGPEEKEALMNANELAARIELLSDGDYNSLRQLL